MPASQRINIAYITNNPNLGSTARVFLDWFRMGREAGLEPVVMVPKPGPLKAWLDSNDFTNRIIDASPFSSDRPWHSLLEIMRAAWLMRRSKVAIIHCMEHNCYPFAWRLAKLLRIPVVCHVQYKVERDYCEWAFGKGHPPSQLIWTAESQKRDSSEAVSGIVPPESQMVLPMGIDPRMFGERLACGLDLRKSLGYIPENCVLGIACALRRRKRIHDFIELIRLLRSQFPHVRGLIAGGSVPDETDYESELRNMVQIPELEGSVTMLGDIVDIEPFHQATDISVSTSEYETFGMSVCEAMACSKPVIGYEAGSIAEVVGNSKCIVPTGDLAGLIRIASELVSNDQIRKQYGLLARKRVTDEFDPKLTFRVLSTIYRTKVAG